MGQRGKKIPEHERQAILRWYRRYKAAGSSERGVITGISKIFNRSRNTIYKVVFGDDPKNTLEV